MLCEWRAVPYSGIGIDFSDTRVTRPQDAKSFSSMRSLQLLVLLVYFVEFLSTISLLVVVLKLGIMLL